MAEDAYRAELIHAWRLRRLNEAIEAVRDIRHLLEQDIEAAWKSQRKIGGLE